MGDGFKLLDAYVEVTASGKGLAEKVSSDFRAEARGAGERAGSSFGSSMLGGFKGMLGAGIVGGIVSSFGYSVMNQVQNVVGTGFQFAKGAVVDFNSQLENSTIGFTTMLGSAQKANVFLQQLQQFAKTTPFEFSNLVQNAQQMMGMGIAAKDVIPDLTALGDSVASMGGNADQVNQVTLAFDQMAAKGTLDMGNMNQLMQGGVPSALKILASAYGVTTGKMIGMISTGKVQADVALPALVKGIEKGTKATAALGGMMDKQSATFSGAMSNIGDALNQTIAKDFRPFFKIIETGTQQLAAFVSTKQFANFVNTVATAMTGGLKKVQGFIGGITEMFSPAHSPAVKVGGWLRQMSQLPKPRNPFTGFIDAISKSSKNIPDDLKKAFSSLESSAKKALPNLIEFGKTTAPKLITLFDQLIKLAPKVGTALGNLSPVLKPLGYVFNNFIDKAVTPTINKIGDFLDLLNGKKGAANTLMMDGLTGKLGTEFQIIGNGVADAAKAVKWLIGDFASNWARGISDTKGFVSDFIGTIGNIIAWLNGVDSTMHTIGSQIVGGLIAGIQEGAGGIASAIANLVGLIPAGARKLLGIASPSKVFHTIGSQVGQGLHLGLLGSVDQIKTTSQKMIDAVMGKGGWAGTTLGSKMVAAIRSDAKVLEGLSVRRDKASANLAGAQSNLRQVYSDRASFWGNVSSGVRSSADITSLYGATTGAAATTLNGVAYQPSYTSASGLGGVAGNLKGILATTKRFTANLALLAKMGIDPITYGQLVQAGPMAAIGLSDQLVHDPAGFKQIVSLERQISAAGSALGKQTATRTYAGQLAGAQRAVAADQRTVNHYTFAMTIDAKKIDDLAKLVRMVESVKRTARAR